MSQIADPLTWARYLSEAGPGTHPDQRTAYQSAKTALLARITDHEHPPQPSTKDTL